MLCKFWPAAIYFNMKSDQNFPIDQTLSARCLFQLHYAINFVCEHFSFDLSVGSFPLAQLSETSAELSEICSVQVLRIFSSLFQSNPVAVLIESFL
jgi:hypothetical protein